MTIFEKTVRVHEPSPAVPGTTDAGAPSHLYRPVFAEDEFRQPAPHYVITIGGKRLLYAYIRKNACTAFKHLINRRLHPRYWLRKTLGRPVKDRYHIGGNMVYFAHPRDQPVDVAAFDAILFAHRDPLERFVSLFLNKFVDDSGAQDIQRNYAKLYGRPLLETTFEDFRAYSEAGFAELDCHFCPQKAHLWDLPYQPLRMTALETEMARVIGSDHAERFFARPANASRGGVVPYHGSLETVPVAELREMKARGISFGRDNFRSPDLETFLRGKYWQDYDMLSEIG